MAREDKIREAMRSAGIYNEIFEDSISTLAKAERQLSRAEKEWRKAGGKMVTEQVNKAGAAYTAKDPFWAVVEAQRRDVQTMREKLGLTPSGLKKVQARTGEADPARRSKVEQLLDAAHDYAADHATVWAEEVDRYVDGALSGDINVCEEIVQACRRYREDLASGIWDFRTDEACEIIAIIETTCCHQQGQFLDATPLRGTPFLLLPYHKFCIFNILGFYKPGSAERRFKEALIFIPRKNIKTTFAAALAWALALTDRASGSKVYAVGGALKQALEVFGFLKYNIRRLRIGVDDDPVTGLRIIDNNMERSISGDVGDGYININALASSPDKQDSFNANVIIADELHTYKSPTQYQVLKDATAAYTNKLVLGISSGGQYADGFCARHVAYAKRILDKTITGAAADEFFVFVAKAPDDALETGSYLTPEVLESCNPGWGQSIRPQELINTAQRAHDDPQLRTELAQKRLNLFTAALKAWFDIAVWRRSDEKFHWSIEQLAKLPVQWYGGSDLSRLHDLTATVLFGNYQGTDIIIPHCWFPRTAAIVKAQDDRIPLFGWEEDGWLSMSNDEVVDHYEAVAWYAAMRRAGFKIKLVAQDRKFAKEYAVDMKNERFRIVDQPQTDVALTAGFRYLDNSARKGTLYYCHAEPVEYCAGNVRAAERGSVVHFEKIQENLRIDVFDAAVFACSAFLNELEKSQKVKNWFGDEAG